MPHERLGGRLLAVASVLIVGWSVLVGCSGIVNRPIDVPGCFPGATTVTCNVVHITVTTDGPYTLVLNGHTMQGNSSGANDVYGVVLGTHDITGTTSGSNLTIGLTSVASSSGGVVQRGSLANLAGPGGTVAACSVGYSIPSGGPRPQSFQARYTLYSGPNQC